jgi:NAD/NADP transhydrogenase alpha subunit
MVLGIGAGSVALIAIAVAALLGLVIIVVAPSRRVRAERRLDPDVEAALLLGEDPEEESR